MKNAVIVSVAARIVAIGTVDGCEDELTISLLSLLLLLSYWSWVVFSVESIDDGVAMNPHDCNAASTSTLVNNTQTARVLTKENTGNTPDERKHKKTRAT